MLGLEESVKKKIYTGIILLSVAVFMFVGLGRAVNSIKSNNSDSFETRLQNMHFDEEKYKIPEIVLGSPNAKYTVMLYSSFSCNHCMMLHLAELPKFIKEYVEKGKVRLIIRYYIDDMASFEASVLVVYFSKDDSQLAFSLMKTIFANQENWRKVRNKPLFIRQLIAKTMNKIRPKSVEHYMKLAEKCLSMQEEGKEIGARLMNGQKRADLMRIGSIPCLIFNGKFDKNWHMIHGKKHEGIMNFKTMWQYCERFDRDIKQTKKQENK